MTNFNPSDSRQWITRERVLMALPMGGGVMVCIAIALGGIGPLFRDVQELERRSDRLRQLQRSVPALERRMESETRSLQAAEQQQALLLGLVAGRDNVQTFLALLNQEALAAGVAIERYEPITSPPPAPSKTANRQRTKAQDKPEKPQDPLAVLGYVRLSVALQVSGPYAGLQDFLQRMEALQLLVVSSDLSLKTIAPDKPTGVIPSKRTSTQLTLTLSFYDRRLPTQHDSANTNLEDPS